MSRFKLPIGGDDLAFDEAAINEQLHHDVRRLVHDRVAHAFSEVTEAILSRDGLVETGQAGLTLPWSTGPVEGQINRLKMLKRQMYGRANIDLLRQRVLLPT